MTDRRQVWAIAATVVFGLALTLLVVAVAFLGSLHEEYGPSGWRWWADQTSYLILGVPVLLAVVGRVLARRARRP
jgi:ABC-type Fe3+ transport system permease subunit